MRSVVISSLCVCALSLVACGGGSGSTDSSSSGTSATAESPRSQQPTPAEAWKQDDPAPSDAPAYVAKDDDGPEDTDAEDRGYTGAAKPVDGVAQSGSALSTTTGTTFDLTYYWIANRPSGDPNQVTLRDCDGTFMTYASYAWRDDVRMEMTGRYKDSAGVAHVFNDAGGCWKKMSTTYSWGMGVPSPVTGTSYKLRPFRSIAVDKSVLSIGKWYYIKELDGVTMPSPVSGLVHDGCVRAVDQGYGIYGKHIDFFSGLESAYSKLVNGSSTIGGRETITVYDGSAKCSIHIARGY